MNSTPRTGTADKPIRPVSKLCRRCGRALDQWLIVHGENYHVTCNRKGQR